MRKSTTEMCQEMFEIATEYAKTLKPNSTKYIYNN